MGGLAAVIDWDRPVAPDALDPMLALTPHRATGGTRRIAREHAVLAESFFAHDAPKNPDAVTIGHLSIVGDLRLWNRHGLRARVGGATGMDDRRLLLEAYRRTGIEFLDDVDGDFAFVIWDDREQCVIAVRDRFGAKPLYFEHTRNGVRFASEVKQLVSTSRRPIEPNSRSVAEYLTGRHVETRLTFLEGIERVRPSTALIFGRNSPRSIRYWDPVPDTVPPASSGDVSEGFRNCLIDSVRRHLTGSDVALAHLTGGLDSSSITAAAHILADEHRLGVELHTVSALFPGYANDESLLISEIAARQPFAHHDFVPRAETIEQFEADMWASDTPRPAPIDLWTGTIDTAHAIGADVVLTGYGGDEVLDQYHVLSDLLRHGSVGRWVHGARGYSSWSGRRLDRVVMESLRGALPAPLKRSIRLGVQRSNPPKQSLIRSDVWSDLLAQPAEANPTDMGFPSVTQNLVVAYTRDPLLGLLLEYDEMRHARAGLNVTSPFLDRQLVEYVASIPVSKRPLSTRTKTLARRGFSDRLPSSVVDLRTKTVAGSYLDAVVARCSPYFRNRFPSVSDPATDFLDADKYRLRLSTMHLDAPAFEHGSIWSAWTFMAWLDGLGQYRQSSNGRSNETGNHP